MHQDELRLEALKLAASLGPLGPKETVVDYALSFYNFLCGKADYPLNLKPVVTPSNLCD